MYRYSMLGYTEPAAFYGMVSRVKLEVPGFRWATEGFHLYYESLIIVTVRFMNIVRECVCAIAVML